MTRWIACAAVLVAWFGCQEAREHPPGASLGCEAGQNCVSPPPVGSGTGGTSGAAGAPPVDAGTTDIEGSIDLIVGDDFLAATDFVDVATVQVGGVSGDYDGQSFSLAAVPVAIQEWASIVPLPGEALTTHQPIDTTQAGPFQLYLVARTPLELVYASLTNPTTIAPGTAQVVLRFLAPNGAPVSGVTVSVTAEAIAYDVAGGYSDVVTETGPAGTALLVNVPALAEPVKKLVQVQANSLGSLDLLVQADAVTLADVVVQ